MEFDKQPLLYRGIDKLVESPPFQGGTCGFDPRCRDHMAPW